MSKITVREFDTRGTFTGHSSGSSTAGKLEGHTPVPNSYTPDAVQPENQACCEHGKEGEVSVALKPGVEGSCQKAFAGQPQPSAPDSVFRGTGPKPMTSRGFPFATGPNPAANTDSVAVLGKSRDLAKGDSIANPDFGFQNLGGHHQAAPGLPLGPGKPKE